MPQAFPDTSSPSGAPRAGEAVSDHPEMIEALRAQHLRIVYQPQYALPTMRLSGFEALVRLSLGPGGPEQWVAPERFLPLAHAAGLMGALTLYMVEAACRTLQAWRQNGRAPVFIAVNIEADDLADILFASHVCRLLAEYRIRPGELEFELVERHLVHLGDTSQANIAQLRAAGIRLVMDDFGTGHSALAQLAELPFDVVKIDKAFLTRVPDAGDACSLLTNVIHLCRALHKEVVIEGVESDIQLHWLARLRWPCLRLQGNGLSFPLLLAEAGDHIPRASGPGNST